MKRRVWIFGEVAVFLAEAAFRADTLLAPTRITSNLEFSFLVKRWMGNPSDRAAVLEIERTVSLVTRSMPWLGRTGGREMDQVVLSTMQFAFESRKLIVFKNFASPLSAAFSGSQGRRWEIEGEQIVQPHFPLPARMLAEYAQVTDERALPKALERWLKQTDTRRVLLDIYRASSPLSTHSDLELEDRNRDREITAGILAAWSRKDLFHLHLISLGGSGDDEDIEAAAADAQAKRQRGPEKTWIEIVLVDDSEQPVGGAKYRLQITDGSLREGKLDQNGAVRVNGIDPGNCLVTFPEIDANEWHHV